MSYKSDGTEQVSIRVRFPPVTTSEHGNERERGDGETRRDNSSTVMPAEGNRANEWAPISSLQNDEKLNMGSELALRPCCDDDLIY
jgi:hypothetical protein